MQSIKVRAHLLLFLLPKIAQHQERWHFPGCQYWRARQALPAPTPAPLSAENMHQRITQATIAQPCRGEQLGWHACSCAKNMLVCPAVIFVERLKIASVHGIYTPYALRVSLRSSHHSPTNGSSSGMKK